MRVNGTSYPYNRDCFVRVYTAQYFFMARAFGYRYVHYMWYMVRIFNVRMRIFYDFLNIDKSVNIGYTEISVANTALKKNSRLLPCIIIRMMVDFVQFPCSLLARPSFYFLFSHLLSDGDFL